VRKYVAVACLTLGSCLPSLSSPTHAGELDYLSIVKTYAETLLEHGRDTYGEKKTPLIAILLDHKTLQLFPRTEDDRLFQLRLDDWEHWGVRNSERCFWGSNPHKDQNLYQILYALTKITGKKHYAQEADRTLKYFFENCQSDTTGLFAWGEHMGWDFRQEGVAMKRAAHNSTHEFGRAWALWERSFELAPEACNKFARGLWDHQIADQSTGNFSRHAGYFEHKTELNSEYPRHGGFYIATWGEAYRRTQDPVYLKAIDTLVTYFDKRRSPKSGAVPAESNKRSGGQMLWVFSNVSLSVDVWDAAQKVPSDLSQRLVAFAKKCDEVFFSLGHDLTPNGKGLLQTANVHSLEPFGGGGPWPGFSPPWGEADSANVLFLRYQQVKDPRHKDAILQIAERFMRRHPTAEICFAPQTLGSTIFHLLNAHKLSGDARYLERAEMLAKTAYGYFLGDGRALPKATVSHPHYEANTGADGLMMAFLELWHRKSTEAKKIDLVWSSR
jgi:hypothetical protein